MNKYGTLKFWHQTKRKRKSEWVISSILADQRGRPVHARLAVDRRRVDLAEAWQQPRQTSPFVWLSRSLLCCHALFVWRAAATSNPNKSSDAIKKAVSPNVALRPPSPVTKHRGFGPTCLPPSLIILVNQIQWNWTLGLLPSEAETSLIVCAR